MSIEILIGCMIAAVILLMAWLKQLVACRAPNKVAWRQMAILGICLNLFSLFICSAYVGFWFATKVFQ